MSRSRDRRARATGRLGVTNGERYALLPEEILQSGAYHAQPDWARTVLFALACRFTGHRNGDISLPFSEARRFGIAAQWKLYAGLRLLELAGVIVCTRRGRLQQGTKLPSLYALTWRRIDKCEGIALDSGIAESVRPSNDWVRWTKPADWRSIVTAIARKNRGTSKLGRKIPDSNTLGAGRSQQLGAESGNTAPHCGVQESVPTAPHCGVTSKISEETARGAPKRTRARSPDDSGSGSDPESARVRKLATAHPGMSDAELAKVARVDPAAVRRALGGAA